MSPQNKNYVPSQFEAPYQNPDLLRGFQERFAQLFTTRGYFDNHETWSGDGGGVVLCFRDKVTDKPADARAVFSLTSTTINPRTQNPETVFKLRNLLGAGNQIEFEFKPNEVNVTKLDDNGEVVHGYATEEDFMLVQGFIHGSDILYGSQRSEALNLPGMHIPEQSQSQTELQSV
jgi:hypothetical protein